MLWRIILKPPSCFTITKDNHIKEILTLYVVYIILHISISSNRRLWSSHQGPWAHYPFALPIAQNVVLVEKRTTGGKSVVHQSLTKKGRLSMFLQSLLNLKKGNLTGRSISIALRPVITRKTAPKHQFRISYTSIPCQLIRSPRMTLKPS